MIVVLAPADPAVPVVVTPVVYSEPPPCVPFDVVENLNGWPELLLSDWSKVYAVSYTHLTLPTTPYV